MSQDFLLALVAKMYYVDKVKQREIAERLHLTPMAVSRALKEADQKGIVTYHVKMPWLTDLELGRAVREKYRLKECFALEVPQGGDIPAVLGAFLADYFIQILPAEAVVGFSWGYTISKFVESLPYVKTRSCSLIQLTGAFTGCDPDVTPTHIINQVSKKLDGRIYVLNAPLYASSREIKEHLLEDPVNVQIQEMADRSDINIIGLSNLDLNATTFRSGITSEADYEELVRLGATGDLAGTFLDGQGNTITWSKSQLYTGVPLSQISRGKHVICVGGEPRKAPLLRLVCGKGYFDTLVTTSQTARELLK